MQFYFWYMPTQHQHYAGIMAVSSATLDQPYISCVPNMYDLTRVQLTTIFPNQIQDTSGSGSIYSFNLFEDDMIEWKDPGNNKPAWLPISIRRLEKKLPQASSLVQFRVSKHQAFMRCIPAIN